MSARRESSGPAGPSPLAREYVRRALERGRLSHAYLLLGPEASGREAFATELAQLVFCPEGGPCGSCRECRRIAHGNHPGVGVYRAPEGRTLVDIDTVRDLCERSHYARSHAFVAILEHADRLTGAAANALLKTLEEPPGEFVLVLTAASSGALLPTIVSRCHRLHLSASGSEVDAGDAVDSGVVDELFEPSFWERDTRDWLARAAPGESTARRRLARLLGELIRRERTALAEGGPAAFDASLDRLETLLDLQRALEGSVYPDLVLEKALATFR